MKIIAVTNQKGGVGKTTTATAMAAGLKQRGYRVLLGDMDPQSNSTDTYRAKIEDQATLFDVLCAGDKISEAIQHTDAGDIVASDPLLADAERRMTEQGREFRLKEALEEIENDYDYIVLDTPPGLGILLTNALTAATSCVIPVSADRYALQGLSGLDKSIARVRKYSNRDLKIDGLLLCKYNPNLNLSKTVMEAMRTVAKNLGTKTFSTTIRETVAAKEAQAARMTLFEAAPTCTAARDYNRFLDEYLYDSEGIYMTPYGILQKARAFHEEGGLFRLTETDSQWGIRFEYGDLSAFIYSKPEGCVFAQCSNRGEEKTLVLAGRQTFSGENAQTAQSVCDFVLNFVRE